jgi:DNA-binding transcriptional ArsR family regulator
MIPKEVYEMQAQLCRALGQATRLEIVYILHDNPQHVNSLAQAMGLSQAALSRHLKVLRDNSIVIAQRQVQGNVYHLANPKIVDICDLIHQILTEQLIREAKMTGKVVKQS